ncbi:MAG: hypothetical protein AAF594_11945, partial [Bacteroidota bacterium]
MTDGPPLERLTQRLQACPDVFLDPEAVDVAAVLADAARTVADDPLLRLGAAAMQPDRPVRALAVALVGAWLVADEAFTGVASAEAVTRLLAEDLDALAAVVRPKDCVTDAGRREEMARFTLAALGLRPAGETGAQAADRLATLDSAARLAVVR